MSSDDPSYSSTEVLLSSLQRDLSVVRVKLLAAYQAQDWLAVSEAMDFMLQAGYTVHELQRRHCKGML